MYAGNIAYDIIKRHENAYSITLQKHLEKEIQTFLIQTLPCNKYDTMQDG